MNKIYRQLRSLSVRFHTGRDVTDRPIPLDPRLAPGYKLTPITTYVQRDNIASRDSMPLWPFTAFLCFHYGLALGHRLFIEFADLLQFATLLRLSDYVE